MAFSGSYKKGLGGGCTIFSGFDTCEWLEERLLLKSNLLISDSTRDKFLRAHPSLIDVDFEAEWFSTAHNRR
jgi:hypothetical protein